MNAYAIRLDGAYWLVNAITAARAKGLVLREWRNRRADVRTLRCRRWPLFDGWPAERVDYWGVPGERCEATGGLPGETPAPFAERAQLRGRR